MPGLAPGGDGLQQRELRSSALNLSSPLPRDGGADRRGDPPRRGNCWRAMRASRFSTSALSLSKVSTCSATDRRRRPGCRSSAAWPRCCATPLLGEVTQRRHLDVLLLGGRLRPVVPLARKGSPARRAARAPCRCRTGPLARNGARRISCGWPDRPVGGCLELFETGRDLAPDGGGVEHDERVARRAAQPPHLHLAALAATFEQPR